ncbi:MAG: 30S ribosomal protein S17 [Elusimicrobia bacterium]|jgi:small subunit ribosomal protein S17|nr:30S ribosomal protein S17 [Elusimicrobiota bacterium]
MNKEYKTTSRKKIRGVVISDKMDKTRVVESEKRFRDPLYKKVIKKHKKFYAHDEKDISKTGDLVVIEETRPMSKLKRWRVVEVRNKE